MKDFVTVELRIDAITPETAKQLASRAIDAIVSRTLSGKLYHNDVENVAWKALARSETETSMRSCDLFR